MGQQECKTEVRQAPEESCTNTQEEVCDIVTRQVPEQVCENVTEKKCSQVQDCAQEQQCTTETKTFADTTYVDECTDVVTQVCNDVTQVSSVPLASYTAAPVVASSVGVATSPLALSSAPIASAALATPALVSSPSAVNLASSQLYRGKRDADAEADPQYLING